VTVVAGGVAGFVSLGGVGPIEAAFWLVDPASIAIHYQSTENGHGKTVKAFAVVVFSALVLAGVWIGETVLSTAFGGRMREELERVQTQRAIDDAEDHVVICGYGLFGRTIADRVTDEGREVVAVENDAEVFDRMDPNGVLPVEGDARNEDVLRDAAIDDAAAVVAAIDDSNANIQIAITASQIAPDVRLVVRVGDEDYTSVARRAGADEVVIPEVSSGEDVSDSL
jgi:glutamate dehydrogenase/leucine dehydrogenase